MRLSRWVSIGWPIFELIEIPMMWTRSATTGAQTTLSDNAAAMAGQFTEQMSGTETGASAGIYQEQ